MRRVRISPLLVYAGTNEFLFCSIQLSLRSASSGSTLADANRPEGSIVILQDAPDHLILIRQTDHAVLSGFLAREWGNSTFTRPELFETFCFAVREHDNGWTEWEAAPQLEPKTR